MTFTMHTTTSVLIGISAGTGPVQNRSLKTCETMLRSASAVTPTSRSEVALLFVGYGSVTPGVPGWVSVWNLNLWYEGALQLMTKFSSRVTEVETGTPVRVRRPL